MGGTSLLPAQRPPLGRKRVPKGGYNRRCGLALSAEGLGDVGAWRLARPTNQNSGGTLQLGKRAIAEPSGRASSWGS